MSGEYWQKIIQARNQRQISEAKQAQLQRPVAPEPIWHGPDFLDLIQTIFEDIRRNAPEIQKEPYSRVRRAKEPEFPWGGVVLEWGSKLEPTSQEKELIEKYFYEISGQRKPSFLPDKILTFDGYYMTASLGEYHDNDRYTQIPGTDVQHWASDFVKNTDHYLSYIEKGFALACKNRTTRDIRLWNSSEAYRSPDYGL